MFLLKLIFAIVLCSFGFFIAYGIGNLFGFDWKWVFVFYGQLAFFFKVLTHDDD